MSALPLHIGFHAMWSAQGYFRVLQSQDAEEVEIKIHSQLRSKELRKFPIKYSLRQKYLEGYISISSRARVSSYVSALVSVIKF